MMLLAFLLLQASSPDILVTGKRLAEEYAACRRGACTPSRDAQVSIAYAETQFRDGRYLDAKATLAAAVSRNRTKGAIAPKPVAALYEAYATVALHEGDEDVYPRAVAGRVHTLKDNLPASDSSVVGATPALGDMWIKLRNYRQADIAYRAAERSANAAGEGRAALLAMMKRAALASATGRQATARTMVDEMAARPAANDPMMANLLRVVRFRIAARDADDATMTALIRDLGVMQTANPALLWEPPYSGGAAAAARAQERPFDQRDAVPAVTSQVDGIEWIDVGFWIRPDGRTAEAEVLRESKSHPWAREIVRRIDGRRYASFAANADASPTDGGGLYKVERVTRKSGYAIPIGSLIPRRIAVDGFETLDLTDPNAKPN